MPLADPSFTVPPDSTDEAEASADPIGPDPELTISGILFFVLHFKSRCNLLAGYISLSSSPMGEAPDPRYHPQSPRLEARPYWKSGEPHPAPHAHKRSCYPSYLEQHSMSICLRADAKTLKAFYP